MPCGSAASVGVEGVASAWGAQRRQSSPPLVSRRLESVADGVAAAAAAAASYNPVVAVTQKCVATKKGAVDAVAPRQPRIYPGPPLIAETSKEDAMEPETKEEDERRSSTPSPEVAFFFCFFFSLSVSFRRIWILGKFVLLVCDRAKDIFQADLL